MAALVLAVAIATAIGAITIANAACTTKVYFKQGGVAVTGPIAPESSGDIFLECLHDAFGNPTPNQTVNFSVTPPGGTLTSVGSGTTDALGNASVPFGGPTETSIYGTYGLRAQSGVVTVNGSVVVGAGAPAGTFTLTKTELAPKAGDALHVQAVDVVDGTGQPVSNGTIVTFAVLGPSGFARSYTAPTSGVSTSVDTATAELTVPGADLVRAGSYTIKGTAGPSTGGAKSNPDLTFNIGAGAVAQIGAGVNPAAVTVGDNYTVKALNGLDSYGNKAVGQAVVFEITDALSNVTTISTDASSNPILLDSNGNASETASAAAADQAYGTYTLLVKSGSSTASPPLTYSVLPGPANAITSAASSEALVPAGSQVTLTVNGVKYNTFAAKTGTIVRIERTAGPGAAPAPQQKAITGVTKADDPSGVSFDLPGELQQIAGTYTYKVTAENATAFINFDVVPGSPVADLVVSALDARQYQNATVNVSSYPALTTTFRLHVTRPDGTTFDVNDVPNGDPSAIVVAASNLTKLGTYAVQVYAKDATNAIIGTGSGAFSVSTAVPDTIAVVVSDGLASGVFLPLQTVSITATATMNVGGSPVPTPGRGLRYVVRNALGQTVAAGTKIADQNGKISFSVFATQTLLPGPYTVSVTDDGGASGTATFLV